MFSKHCSKSNDNPLLRGTTSEETSEVVLSRGQGKSLGSHVRPVVFRTWGVRFRSSGGLVVDCLVGTGETGP